MFTPNACNACKRLKRKCSRDVPSCSLCIRLNKRCEYAGRERQEGFQATSTEPSTHTGSSPAGNALLPGPDHSFPPEFFLDQELHRPLPIAHLTQSPCLELSLLVSEYLGTDSATLYQEYHAKVHVWLPMLSKKRVLDDGVQCSARTDACHSILLLCMKLCTTKPGHAPRDLHLYTAARSLCSAAEQAGYLSLRLVQALILLSFYELFHAIQPNAYLTMARAARIGSLVGLYTSRDQPNLFQHAPTWTASEEARRTWWTMFVLDRIMNVDTTGLPFALPDSDMKELLPVNDDDWEAGKIVASESLYTSSFSRTTILGPFATLCQAANVLNKVLQHRMARRRPDGSPTELMAEAMHLHRISSSLQLSIESTSRAESEGDASGCVAALAVCSMARICLYNQYACNSAYAHGPSTALQTELQHASLEGILVLIATTLPRLAQLGYECPMLAHCLYFAAGESAWFIKEGSRSEMIVGLRDFLGGLRRIERAWAVAGEFMSLLRREGVLELLEDA